MAAKKKPSARSSRRRTATQSDRSRALEAKRAAPLPPRRTCGTMANHMRLLEMYPSFRDRLFKLEQDTERYRARDLKLANVPVATIKVVVNIVFNDPSQNISDGQIRTQIGVLNRDFRRRNPDRSKTPTAFKGLVSDSRIQFVLDRVIRKQTNKLSFLDDNGVKKASTGGIAPVDTTKFLNIWVCALGGGLLGYAQFPGGPVATDGVVIHYRAFGTRHRPVSPTTRGVRRHTRSGTTSICGISGETLLTAAAVTWLPTRPMPPGRTSASRRSPRSAATMGRTATCS